MAPKEGGGPLPQNEVALSTLRSRGHGRPFKAPNEEMASRKGRGKEGEMREKALAWSQKKP